MPNVAGNLSITDGKDLVLLLRRIDGQPFTIGADIRDSMAQTKRFFPDVVAYFLAIKRDGHPVYELSDNWGRSIWHAFELDITDPKDPYAAWSLRKRKQPFTPWEGTRYPLASWNAALAPGTRLLNGVAYEFAAKPRSDGRPITQFGPLVKAQIDELLRSSGPTPAGELPGAPARPVAKRAEADMQARPDAEGWNSAELEAAVGAYVEMQQRVRSNQKVVKKDYYDQLSKRFGRTAKAFEYRMQNISYVLGLMGREWLPGLVPARNVGAKVAKQIESLLHQAEGRKSLPVAEFAVNVREEANRLTQAKPSGNTRPATTEAEVMVYLRDAAVKAWVLKTAGGKCECCGATAPFTGVDGLPFLEVHHVRQLADRGTDTVENAIGVCPNCHRELHHGANAKARKDQLYATIERLVRQ